MRVFGLLAGLVATLLWTITSIPAGLVSGVSVVLLWQSFYTAFQNEVDGFGAAAEIPAKVSFLLAAFQLLSLAGGIAFHVQPSLRAEECNENYSGRCVPIASDVDCVGQSDDGPAYTRGPVSVVGSDVYELDSDGDGIGCE